MQYFIVRAGDGLKYGLLVFKRALEYRFHYFKQSVGLCFGDASFDIKEIIISSTNTSN